MRDGQSLIALSPTLLLLAASKALPNNRYSVNCHKQELLGISSGFLTLHCTLRYFSISVQWALKHLSFSEILPHWPGPLLSLSHKPAEQEIELELEDVLGSKKNIWLLWYLLPFHVTTESSILTLSLRNKSSAQFSTKWLGRLHYLWILLQQRIEVLQNSW